MPAHSRAAVRFRTTVMKCDPTLYRAAPPSLAVKPRLIRQLFLPPLILMLMIGLGYIAYLISEHSGIKSLRETGERQLELHARTVESEISKYTYLPSVLELESSVSQLLNKPSPELQQQVNRYLEGMNRRSGSRAIYVMDTTGRVLATSNWRDSDSYQGEDLSFRAYFQDAVRGLPGRFYGIGTTTGESGYYLAHGLEDKGRIIGVAVIKVRLEALEERWQRARLEAFVSDENGIIILSSDPARRLKSVRPLTPQVKERLARSLQYYWWPLNELVPLERETLSEGVEKLVFPANVSVDREHKQVSYLAQSRPLSDTAWHLTLLTPLEDLRREAANQGMLVAVACALVTFLLIAWNERRKVISTRLAAREALQAANNELERKIAERTEHLRASNERLKAQIRERRQAEDTLRRAQDELVQAGKLAAIGQMSTSIAHELNQPLAALRTLSGNTVRFLERGALDTASANLRTINDLVDRMGRITASLRAFARRGDDQGQAQLSKAVEAAAQLLGVRLEQSGLTLHRDFVDATLSIDQTRLEQILVNLIGNALDAMFNQPAPELWLTGSIEDGRYRLRVRDNGHGIDTETRKHLFEPFFTTKPGEQGLGLGLTLSASLAAAAGGSLSAEHPGDGGTTFVLSLPFVPDAPTDNRPSGPGPGGLT
ncbi:Sensor histidine kinase [Pseudomonas savastanoi pv. phaseolicola]|nr:Sensor histidine kinase [Pseudomonas savastanoi pv. phaseolicola]